MTLWIFAQIVISVSLNALAQILLRKAMLTMAAPPLGHPALYALALCENVWLLGGMLCYAASIGLWLSVLRRVPVSSAYPMLSLGYILAAALGYFLLGEPVGAWRGSGIALICAGVFLVARA